MRPAELDTTGGTAAETMRLTPLSLMIEFSLAGENDELGGGGATADCVTPIVAHRRMTQSDTQRSARLRHRR